MLSEELNVRMGAVMPDERSQITDNFAKLCDIVAKLRAPDGCPWDREQTNQSLLPALIEEVYEAAEAARAQDNAHFREELGDLLLLVVMHAQIARETGRFDIDEVIEGGRLPRAGGAGDQKQPVRFARHVVDFFRQPQLLP